MFYFRRKNHTKKLITASVISAVVAGMAGFLSHKDNRDKTVDKINNLGDKMKDFGQEATKNTESTYKDISNKVSDFIDNNIKKDKNVTTVKSVNKTEESQNKDNY
jgi:hypothetical protein